MSKKYLVVVCPNCDDPRIIGDGQDTMKCFSCGKSHSVESLYAYHKTNDREEAAVVLGQMNAGDEKDEFVETVRENPDKFKQTKENTPSSQREKFLAAVNSEHTSSKKEVINYAEENYGLSPKKGKKLLRKLEANGSIIVKTDGTIQEV